MHKVARLTLTAFASAALASGGAVRASDNPAMDAQVNRIDNQWAHIKYQVRDANQQFSELQALAQQAAEVAARYPNKAEPLLWQGIVTSEEAADASMFRKMGFARAARAIFDRAKAINPKAGNGGVLMSLGVLYYRVPGFPIGFGDSKKAKAFLDAALALDPNGLDSNFFYGDFLNAQGDKNGAKAHLLRALKAPANPARPVWDAGRRAEARALLVHIQRRG